MEQIENKEIDQGNDLEIQEKMGKQLIHKFLVNRF